MKHKLILAAAVSLAMASTAMAQSSDTTSGASSDTSATTSGSTTASPGMLQMTEAEKSTTANWSGAIADAFFADSTMTSLKSADEIRTGWSSLTPEQQAQVEQDCNTMQTASAPATDSGTTTGTSTDTTASASGSTGTTTGTSGETTASTSTGTAGSMTEPTTVAQLCDFVGSL